MSMPLLYPSRRMSQRSVSSRPSLLPDAIDLYRRSFHRCRRLVIAGAIASAAIGFYPAFRLEQLMTAVRTTFTSALNAPQDSSGLGVLDMSSLQTLASELTALAAGTLGAPSVWLSYLGAALVTLACHGLIIHEQSMIA